MILCNKCSGVIYELGEYQYDDACTCTCDDIKAELDHYKAEAEGQFNEAVKTIDLLTESLNDKGLRLMKAAAERDELIIILFDMIKWGIINEN